MAHAVPGHASAGSHGVQHSRRCTYHADTMGPLDGKVAVVTGAGRGFRRAFARGLACEGAAVAAAGQLKDANIAANALGPGLTDTEHVRQVTGPEFDYARTAEPEDSAPPMVFLAHQRPSGMTGHSFSHGTWARPGGPAAPSPPPGGRSNSRPSYGVTARPFRVLFFT